MKWATVFQQVAARPDAIAEIARLNGIAAADILSQVELQTSCAGSNYDVARKAKDALARQAQKRTSETDQAEREASKRADDAKKLQEEVRKRITEEAKEAAKKAVEEEQQRAQAQRDAQRNATQPGAQRGATQPVAQRRNAQPGAQRGAVQPGAQASGPRMAPPSLPVSQARSGCSRSLKVLLGTAVLIGACLAIYFAYKAAGPSINRDTGGRATPTCPPLVTESRKCPWTPEGYGVQPCGPGFCWDGGPQGSLACKQEQAVENSGRTYTTDLVCSEGYTAERDPCTNVILRCVKQ